MRNYLIGTILVSTASFVACGEKTEIPDLSVCSNPANFPANVRNILDTACVGCHSTELTGGARNGANPGVDYNTCEAAVASMPRGLVRMDDSVSPMPPDFAGGQLPADQIAIVRNWFEGLDREPVEPPIQPSPPNNNDDDNNNAPVRDVAACSDESNFPVEVQNVLASCTGCHATTLDEATRNPGTIGFNYDTCEDAVAGMERGLIRMNNEVSPMPPSGQLPADQIAIVQNWFDNFPTTTTSEFVFSEDFEELSSVE